MLSKISLQNAWKINFINLYYTQNKVLQHLYIHGILK